MLSLIYIYINIITKGANYSAALVCLFQIYLSIFNQFCVRKHWHVLLELVLMYNSDRPTRVQVRPRVDISLKKQVGLGHAQHGNNSMWISSTCLRCQARSLVIPAMPQQSYQFTCTFVINVYLFKRRLRGCWREQGGTFHKYQNTKYEFKTIRPTKPFITNALTCYAVYVAKQKPAFLDA